MSTSRNHDSVTSGDDGKCDRRWTSFSAAPRVSRPATATSAPCSEAGGRRSQSVGRPAGAATRGARASGSGQGWVGIICVGHREAVASADMSLFIVRVIGPWRARKISIIFEPNFLVRVDLEAFFGAQVRIVDLAPFSTMLRISWKRRRNI
jgi:hypothetical protein